MTFIFCFFAGVLIWLSFRSFRGGVPYLRFFRSQLTRPTSEFMPYVTVICPCRGVDDGLEGNLKAVADQDYADLEVIFVVDDAGDAAVTVIERIRQTTERATRLIVAPKAIASSQKVENIREAVLHASARSKVFVFVDSDVRPSREWVRRLVAPLVNDQVGAATGYRWFISTRPSFASEMRVAWNASIASALGPDTRSNFCWGGSMAIRRDVFKRLDIRARLHGTLSDDFTVTRILNEADLSIVFVPSALLPSIGDCSFTELVEFTTRQMKITRVYAPKLWLMSLIGSGLFIAVMVTAFLIVMLSRKNDLAVFAATAALVLVSFFSIGKSRLRLAAVKLAISDHHAEIKRQTFTQYTFWLLTPALFLYNAIAAIFSRKVTWRGTTYELKSPTETVIIRD